MFNAETRLSSFPRHCCEATYVSPDNKDACVIIHRDYTHNYEFVVASFRDGYCNNASGFQDIQEAWKLFDEIKSDIMHS